jgi:hypothetical protein
VVFRSDDFPKIRPKKTDFPYLKYFRPILANKKIGTFPEIF